MPNTRPSPIRPKTSDTPTLSHEDYALLADFRFHIRKFLVFSETAARRAGLTARQHQALLAIQGRPEDAHPPTVGELAQILLIRHHSAVGLIDRLAAAGLIRRVHSPSDQREVRLELSPKARRLLAQLTQRHRSEVHRIAPVLRAILSRLERRARPTRRRKDPSKAPE